MIVALYPLPAIHKDNGVRSSFLTHESNSFHDSD
jgi:hypothetical protein